jgi:uncharacterized membrane-anchored protein YitT (DUF2179 family)
MNNFRRSINNIVVQRHLKDAILILLGVTMAAIGLKGFILPNKFLDGGAMGISLLLEMITSVELAYLIVFVNLPFIIMGAKQISLEFAIKSTAAILALAIMVHFLSLPLITSDKLLISIFGGFFLGAGIGLTIRGGAVIDGTEVLAITVSRKSSLSVGDFIAIFNIILFCFALFLIDVETAMHSVLTYLSASKTVDFIINGIEENMGVIIVSEHSQEIKQHLTTNLAQGVTVFKSDKGFGSRGERREEGKILFCVVTRLEVTKLLFEIEKIDPDAFVVHHSIKGTKGGMIKRGQLH